jgi:hypothetical protein
VFHRQVEGKTSPLGFGKYRDKTLEDIAEIDVGYVAWLWSMRILRVENEKDRDWFNDISRAYVYRAPGAVSVDEIPDSTPPKDIRQYKNRYSLVDFGKYKGLTFEDVSALDPQFFKALYKSKLVILTEDLVWFAIKARGITDETESWRL